MTLDPQRLFDALQNSGLRHFAGVPCSILDPLTTAAHGTGRYVAASVEGEALALAAGAWLAGGQAGVLLQNSGLGNCVNTLASLNIAAQIPVVMVLSHRGDLGEFNPAQVPMGQACEQIGAYQTRLERMPLQEVQWNSLNSDHEVARQKYLSLLEKHSVAQLSAELERRQKDETFRMLEPARAPAEPKGFRWPAFALLGSLCGLLAGAAAALACDLGQDVMQGDWELPAGIAFLGRIPQLGAHAPTGRRTSARQQLRALRTATGLGLVLLIFRRGW